MHSDGPNPESPTSAEAASDAAAERHGCNPMRLLDMLHDVQDLLGWLPPAALRRVAERIGQPFAQVHATATFYSLLHTTPPGRYRVLFSDNITDRMLGSAELLQALCRALWVEPGHVSEDGLVSVATTSCTGMCDQGPAALVNGRALTRLTPQRVARLAELIRRRVPLDAWPAHWFVVADHVRRRDWLLERRPEPGAALAAALAQGADSVLDAIDRAGLRGRGGAGFPTALKWRGCRDAPGRERFVVCNADEGEPGTFKDRVLLASEFDRVIDGMAIAALVVGARRGVLYLRAEYRHLLDGLHARLEQRRARRLLGADLIGPGVDFDIEIHVGAGAYVCGEESALLESLEGRPGRPRIRPPLPVHHGYLGQPTVVDNVETLALAAQIVLDGADAFRTRGTASSPGTKLLSISGDVELPGVYEYPFGVSVRELLADCGARQPQAVVAAGAAGRCLAADAFDRRIAFDDVATGGSIMVFGADRDLFELAHNVAHFFADESCGLCTPCRVGTAVNARVLDKLAAHRGSADDLDTLQQLHALMHGSCHCGLGNSASVLLDDLRRSFPQVFGRRLGATHAPAFDLDAALAQARRMTGRDDPGAHLGDRAPQVRDADASAVPENSARLEP